MAIGINGSSNTITGIAVGGLPDGIVDTDMIAASTITAAKLASGVKGKIASYALIADVKASNAEGGAFTSGAWRTRDLNTEISDADSIVSISSNQFTLGAGSYLIKWSANAYRVASHQTRLYNATISANVQHGSSNYSASTGLAAPDSIGAARITLSGSTVFEIQHRSYSSKSSNGFGIGATGGVDWTGTAATDGVIFCQVEIYKEA